MLKKENHVRLGTRRVITAMDAMTAQASAEYIDHLASRMLDDIGLSLVRNYAVRRLIKRDRTSGPAGVAVNIELDAIVFSPSEYEAHIETVRKEAWESGRNAGRYESKVSIRRAINAALDGAL